MMAEEDPSVWVEGGKEFGAIGKDAQLLVAKWLDIRSLARLEATSKSFQSIARDSSLFVHLHRLSAQVRMSPQTSMIESDQPLRVTLALHHYPVEPQMLEDGRLNLGDTNACKDLPPLIKHVRTRGAKLKVLEVIGHPDETHGCAQLPTVDSDDLGAIIESLEGVHLEALALSHFCIQVPTGGDLIASFLAKQESHLRSLILGPICDDSYFAPLQPIPLAFPSPSTIPKLAHLFLSLRHASDGELWLRKFASQLKAVVVVSDSDEAEEARTGARNALRALLRDKASPLSVLDENDWSVTLGSSDFQAASLPSPHFRQVWKQREELVIQPPWEDVSGGGFAESLALQEALDDIGFDGMEGVEYDDYDDDDYDDEDYVDPYGDL